VADIENPKRPITANNNLIPPPKHFPGG